MNGDALKEEEVEAVLHGGSVTKMKLRATPEEVLRKMLDDSLYDPVRRVLGESLEGALRDYEVLKANSELGEVIEKALMEDDVFEFV